MGKFHAKPFGTRHDGRFCAPLFASASIRPIKAKRTQRGAVAIMFAFTLLLMLGFVGIAIDTARLYNRKVELQNLARAVAFSAAYDLNGTSAGVTKALSKASRVAESFRYQYDMMDVTWTDTAIRFSSSMSADANWVDGGAATAFPNGLLFVKVDTNELDSAIGVIRTAFMGMLSSSFAEVDLRGHAVAGRSEINVTPLAICAMSDIPGAARANPGSPAVIELVEYGFRRGVSYDLMQLNPNDTTPENFVISPVDPPGITGSSTHTTSSLVEPFVCTGKMAIPRVIGAPITVARPFPINSLFNALNARFDQYSGSACTPEGAPPDANIKSYPYNNIPWMSTVPNTQTALGTTFEDKLWTIADPFPTPSGNTAPIYGPLWSYAKAVAFASYTAGIAEPAAGYTTISSTAWSTLYKPGQPVATGYPGSGTPYRATLGAYFQAPSKPGVRNRRVLHVPLLRCPVSAGSNVTATVLAIGKFFMTVPATETSISAEFAGVVQEQSLGGPVELMP